MGTFLSRSSFCAISKGSVSPSKSTITGAPKLICKALVPNIFALSYFVRNLVVTRVSLAFLQLLVNLFVPYQATEKLTPLCLSIPLVGSLLPVASTSPPRLPSTLFHLLFLPHPSCRHPGCPSLKLVHRLPDHQGN